MINVTAAYQEVADRLAATVLELTDEQAAASVRSCPGWTVRDVLAHHVGATVDFTTGKAPEVPGRGRIHPRLRQRHRQPPPHGRSFAGKLPASGFPIEPAIGQGVLINDVVVHEGYVRLALGLPPADETPALALSLSNYGLTASIHLQNAGLGAVRLEYERREKILGTGNPVVTLRGTRNDLVRTLASRRSREQILAMDWDGDPTEYVDLLPAYGVVNPDDADPN